MTAVYTRIGTRTLKESKPETKTLVVLTGAESGTLTGALTGSLAPVAGTKPD